MGYLKHAGDTDQLVLPSDPSYWVRMKRRASYGDALAAQSAMMRFTTSSNGSDQVVSEMELRPYLRTLTAALITEWNLDDGEGQPLPITEENLELLDPEDGMFLSKEAQARIGSRSEVQQRDFSKPSGVALVEGASRTKRRSA